MTLTTLAARNLLRNRFRTVLTVMGVAVAIVTFMMLRTLVYAWTSAQDYAAKDRVVTRHKITFVMTLPRKYIDDVRQAPGIKTATFANWFGGKDPKHETEFFGNFAVDGSYFDVMSEMAVPADQMAAYKEDRTGCIVGDMIAKKLGWKLGDVITLESGIFPAAPDKPWQVTVRGIYTTTAKSVDRSSLLFHWEYLNDNVAANRRDEIGWIMSRVTDPSRTAQIGVDLDKIFDSRDIQTLSQDERSFNTSFLAGISAILSAIDIICLVILVIMMLILGNTIAMGVRERTSEYATLRAIGFLPKHLVMFILGEALLTGLLGGILGLAVSYPMLEQGMGRWLEENMGQFFPYFRVPTHDAVTALILSLVLGALAAALPAYSASKLKVTEALRRVA